MVYRALATRRFLLLFGVCNWPTRIRWCDRFGYKVPTLCERDNLSSDSSTLASWVYFPCAQSLSTNLSVTKDPIRNDATAITSIIRQSISMVDV